MGDKKKSISNIDYPLKSSKKLEAALKPGNKTGHVAVMSPKEYLEHAKRLPETKEDNLLIDAFKSRLKKGKKFKALKLLGHNRADGRHRATAAEELGIKEVPVIDYRESGLKNMKGVHSVSKNGSGVGKVNKELRKERKSGGSVYSNVPPQLPINNEDPEAAFRRLIEWSFAVGRMYKADGGSVSDIEAAIKAAEDATKKKEASHEKGVSGAVEFAPVGIEEPLTHARLPLGSLPRETADVVQPALQVASEIAPYFTPAAPIAAARDVAVGLREGDPSNVALSALGLPGKAAKAAAIGASAFMPSEAEAGPINKAINIAKNAMKPPSSKMTGYHLSPHDFESFSSGVEKGTGSQVEGAGAYLSSNPEGANMWESAMGSGPKHLYEVDVPHDWSKFIDRNKPLSEQPEYVQNILDYLNVPKTTPKGAEDIPTTGVTAYEHLRNKYGAEKASQMLSDAGISGMRFPGAGEGYNYVIYDPSSLSIINKERKYAEGGDVDSQESPGLVDRAMQFVSQFNPVGTAEASSLSKAAQEALMAIHNIKSHRVDMLEKLGGLPVPSIAITKPEQGFKSFGDISLVGSPELVKPSRTTPVFAADVYSPRFPSIDEETGKIFKGFTTLGNRRYAPLTMENVVKEMKGNIRGGEGGLGMYGTGSLRAAVTPQFQSLKEIQGSREKIIPKEEFKSHKDKANDLLFSLADEFHPYSRYSGNSFQHVNSMMETLSDVGKGKISAFNQDYKDLPDDLKTKALEYLDYLKNMPTEYFEAKPQRAVGLHEFAGAVVPHKIAEESPKVLDVLKRLGIKRIEEFSPEETKSQAEAFRRFKGLQFDRGGSIVEDALDVVSNLPKKRGKRDAA